MKKEFTTCRICCESNYNELIQIREMQLGTREIFDYFQCIKCSCIQIKEIPEDLSMFYPKNYYSFNQYPLFKKSTLSKFISKHRTRYNLFGNNLLGCLLAQIHPNELLKTIGQSKININSKVLDVGCGIGHTLYAMSTSGMKNLLGIDPYLDEDVKYENGLKILKKSIEYINGKFDLIMLNHVFEHIEDQRKILNNINSLLETNGTCLIRIPTCSSYAWEKYKNNWVQLDAPRHLFIHSIKSIEYIANECGLYIEKIIYDSEPFQFIGSEQYLRNIPLNAENSFFVNRSKSIFTKNDYKEYYLKSKQLNKELIGDQIAIFMRKLN